jgi:hypothetical protein
MRGMCRCIAWATLFAAQFLLLIGTGPAEAHRLTLPGVSTSAYAPIGAALDTAAPGAGGQYAIQIGGNCVPNQSGCAGPRRFPYGSQPVELVVLNRATLATGTSQSLGPGPRSASIAAATATKYGTNGQYLMVLSSLPGTATSPAYSLAISIITGSPKAGSVNWAGGWAAVGVPNTTPMPGEVWGTVNPGFVVEGRYPAGDVHGYFQRAQLTTTVAQYQSATAT